MKRIAVTSIANKNRLIISNALSLLTGLEVTRSTPYSGFSLKYELNKNIDECDWYELYTYALHSFVERIELESAYNTFISNGSVFNEPAYMCANEQMASFTKKRKTNDYSFMSNSLNTIISEYAAKTYDYIVYIPGEPQEMDKFHACADEKLKNMLMNSGVKYFIYHEKTLVETLEKCSYDMMIKSTISPTIAIQNAESKPYK